MWFMVMLLDGEVLVIDESYNVNFVLMCVMLVVLVYEFGCYVVVLGEMCELGVVLVVYYVGFVELMIVVCVEMVLLVGEVMVLFV